MSWLQVSLTVDGELAEAVAEVLARHAPGGVVIESTAVESRPDESGHPVGPLRVCAYLPIDDELPLRRRKIEEGLYYLGRIRPLPEPEFTPLQQTDWTQAWKQHYRPIAVGRRLLIQPAWMDVSTAERIPILIDPGMAFGTGTHPTTQLCLELLEDFTPSQDDVIDIGCGSGILSIAAIKLGARHAFGVDTDEDAVRAAEENATRNAVGEQTTFAVGSVADVLQGIFPRQQAPLVVANILAHILIRLLDEGMASLIAPAGKLLLSGILEDQLADMQAALQRHTLRICAQRQMEDWIALAVEPLS